MAVYYGFFDSINGDRTYNADQISEYFLKLISNGVFATPSNSMQVTATSGLNVKVSAGWGFINCKWVKNDNDYALQLDAADTSFARIDRVVLHLDTTSTHRCITIEVKKGTPAATPAPPTLTRESGVYELSLAQIAIAANATSITQANITDERADTSVCGYVTGLIDQIDTTNLFAQFICPYFLGRWRRSAHLPFPSIINAICEGVMQPPLYVQNLAFLVLVCLIDDGNEIVQHLVDVLLEGFYVVFCDQIIFFQLLQPFVCITTVIAKGDFSIFGDLLQLLNEGLTTLLRKIGENQPKHLAVIVGGDADIGVHDGFFGCLERAAVPNGNHDHLCLRHRDAPHLIEGSGRTVIIHHHLIENMRIRPSGANIENVRLIAVNRLFKRGFVCIQDFQNFHNIV